MLFFIIFISIISFYGCSSNENETSTSQQKEQESEVSSKPKESNSVTPVQKAPSDQENLKLGDTGVIQSTLGKAEITINSFKKVNDIKGMGPQLDFFFISEIEIKNVGDEEIDTVAWTDMLEMAWDLDAAGSPDDSNLFEVEAMNGNLAPGESAKGEVVFDVEDTDQYYFMVSRAMVAGGTVYNNAMWAFKKNEVK